MRRMILQVLCAFWVFSGLGTALAATDLNTATNAQLEALPGIGPAKAAAILQYRADHGGFTSVSQLDAVPGIGPATMANLQGLVTVGGDAPAAPASAPGAAPTRAVASGPQVNINTASATQLQSLPGIGPAKAAAIVSYREQVGSFVSCDQLDAVDGIGPATVAALRPNCVAETALSQADDGATR